MLGIFSFFCSHLLIFFFKISFMKKKNQEHYQNVKTVWRESKGSVVECLTRDPGAAGSSLTGVTEQEH